MAMGMRILPLSKDDPLSIFDNAFMAKFIHWDTGYNSYTLFSDDFPGKIWPACLIVGLYAYMDHYSWDLFCPVCDHEPQFSDRHCSQCGYPL